MSVTDAAWAALALVRDPELDRPITELGFVSEVRADGGRVSVRLRLPTYFCAPNFAFLMVDDARRALGRLPGVAGVDVVLDDHFASGEINAGVAGGKGFADTFNGLAAGELGGLRRIFQRKAFLASQERLSVELADPDVRLGDIPDSAAKDEHVRRRADLGLDCTPAAPLLVDPDGRRVPPMKIGRHLRFARTVRISIEGNEDFCRGLLSTRYKESL